MKAVFEMRKEIIQEVSITDDGELLLSLAGTGQTNYQYIYREGVGVYWDAKYLGFRSTILKGDWSVSRWFLHILATAKSVFEIDIVLDNDTNWSNIIDADKDEILKQENGA